MYYIHLFVIFYMNYAPSKITSFDGNKACFVRRKVHFFLKGEIHFISKQMYKGRIRNS